MNIWVIGRNFPTPKNGMIGSFEYEQAELLARKGNTVVYISLVFHPLKKVKKRGYVTWNADDNLTVCAYSQFYAPERMKIHLKDFQENRWRKFLKRIEKENGLPDVIHVHYPTMITEPVPILDYKRKGVKIVATEHWTHVLNKTLTKREKNQLGRYVADVDEFICVGTPLKQAVQELTGTSKNIQVVPNIVSCMFFENFENKVKETENVGEKSNCNYQFVATGRLVPVKQFDRILEAFGDAFKDNTTIRLTVIGGGPLYKELIKLAKELGIDEQVEFTGTLSRNEVAKQLKQADCLVCFSRLETFGVPVIEAWACGIPAIGTDALGFLEYYDESLGYIVPHDSVSELAEAMKKVVQNRDNYSKEHICAFAEKNFSEDAVYEKLLDIYEETKA